MLQLLYMARETGPQGEITAQQTRGSQTVDKGSAHPLTMRVLEEVLEEKLENWKIGLLADIRSSFDSMNEELADANRRTGILFTNVNSLPRPGYGVSNPARFYNWSQRLLHEGQRPGHYYLGMRPQRSYFSL